MKELYIYHHLGVGDHIICNGIVRHYVELYDRVYVFTKPENKDKILWMFRDNRKIIIIPMGDNGARSFIQFNSDKEFLIPGHQELFKIFNHDKSKTFDELFFQLAKIPFKFKWDKFYIERDLNREKEVLESIHKKIGIKKGESYAFVHDDKTRGWNVHKKYIKSDKIVRPSEFQDIGIFEFFLTIEKASEIHCINSSFAALIDIMQLRNDNLNYHRYARTDMEKDGDTKLKMNWNFID